jgi:voltage-gated potassium channel Kch
MTNQRSEELKNTNYEVFILALSLLSLVNWVLYFVLDDQDELQVLFLVDLLLSFIFLADFSYRLLTAESKSRYFFKQLGWLDLLGSLPFPQAKIARLSRVFRAFLLLRELGMKRVFGEFIHNRAESAIYIVGFLIILVLEFGSAAVLAAEQGAPGSNIETAGEAVWWSIVTMSTVGYGDYSPVTYRGRLIGVIVIIVGVALFGVVTGFLANRFVGSGEATAEAEVKTSPGDLTAILDEIRELRGEYERSYAELDTKFEVIMLMLQENGNQD